MENTVTGRDLFIQQFKKLKEKNRQTSEKMLEINKKSSLIKKNETISRLNKKLIAFNITPIPESNVSMEDKNTSVFTRDQLPEKTKQNLDKLKNIKKELKMLQNSKSKRKLSL